MTEDRASSVSRLDALEANAAHRDAALEDLDAAVRAQWHALDALLRRVQALEEQLAETEARASAAAPLVQPPHF